MPDLKNPNATLSPLDKACESRRTPPDYYGEDFGVAWAAWKEEHLTKDKTWFDVYLVLPSGEKVLNYRSLGGLPNRTRPYFQRSSLEEIRSLCFDKYFRHVREPERPLTGVQEQFKEEQQEKARKRGSQVRRRRRKKRERQRAAKFYGKAPEQVSGADLRAYRNRGTEMARGSFAHR